MFFDRYHSVRSTTFGSLTAVAMLLSACGDSNDSLNAPAPAPAPAEVIAVDDTNADICDLLDDGHCLLPFPNNYFTVAGQATDTGLLVNFSAEATPRSSLAQAADGSDKPIDPAEYNRNDGFSPGAMIMTRVPGVDLEQSGAVPLTDIERSFDEDAPILVIDAETGERQLIWAELDMNALDGDGNIVPEKQVLLIRPGKNLADGRRYIVALRNLKNSAGETLVPADVFRAYRDNVDTDSEPVNDRRAAMNDIFDRLQQAGIARDELYLAWDFTVASTRNLSERMLHIRDDTLAWLGGNSPQFTITDIENFDPDDPDPNAWARRIRGTLIYPNYLNSDDGAPGSSFYYEDDSDDLPDRINGANTLEQPFVCNIPRAVMQDRISSSGPATARPFFYGHGLLGSRNQANKTEIYGAIGNTYDTITCAVNWLGMEEEDESYLAFSVLTDLSNMKVLPDRSQQGFLGWIMLAEALLRDDGFVTDPAFQVDSKPLYNTDYVYYDGDSQGGILGGALMAVAPNISRGVLGVPGMNYSLILRRSSDFAGTAFSQILYTSYVDLMDRNIVFGMMQMLWDRGETNGYANHLGGKDPLPGTPANKVLLHVGFGDHQVTPISAEVIARTIGAAVHTPATVSGRHYAVDPYYGLEPMVYPHSGSALVVWDGGPGPNDYWSSDDCVNRSSCNPELGTLEVPVTNTPPDPATGNDPHERPRRQPPGFAQKSAFWQPDGTVTNVCGDTPCLMDGWDGSMP
jgi:hypothetical protein